MKLKHATFVDKHIEKVILGVGVLIALVIIWLYFIADPYSVEIGGREHRPEDIEASIRQKNDALAIAIGIEREPQVAPDLENLTVPKYDARFWDRRDQPTVKSDELKTQFGGHVLAGNIIGPTGPGEIGPTTVVDVVRPPKVKDLQVAVSPHVLVSRAQLMEELTAQLAEAQALPERELQKLAAERVGQILASVNHRGPGDFNVATISATIDPEQRKQEYLKAAQPMPEVWYRDMLEFVTDVVITREELVNPDAAIEKERWGDPVEIDPIWPGSVVHTLRGYTRAVEAAMTEGRESHEIGEAIQNLVEHLRYHVDDITKPVFLPHKPHRPWHLPTEAPAQLSAEDQDKLYKLNQKIHELEQKRRRIETLIERMANRNQQNQGTNTPRQPIPPRGREYDLPPEALPPRGAQRTPTGNPNEERLRMVNEELDKLYEDRDLLLNPPVDEDGDGVPDVRQPGPDVRNPRNPRDPRYRRDPRIPGEYGIDPETGRPYTRSPRDPRIPPRTGVDPRRAEGDFEADEFKLPPIQLWAHDYAVEPGKTYRYKVTYKVINPLFNKQRSLRPEQHEHAAQIEQASVAAESKPVTVEPVVQYWVEDVRPKNNVVVWGVYTMYNGYRVYKQLQRYPGDLIGDENAVFQVPVPPETDDDLEPAPGAAAPPTEGLTVPIDLDVPAVQLDIRSTAPTSALDRGGPVDVIIADLTDGTIKVHNIQDDLDDPVRKKLRLESEGFLGASASAAGADGTGRSGGGAGR